MGRGGMGWDWMGYEWEMDGMGWDADADADADADGMGWLYIVQSQFKTFINYRRYENQTPGDLNAILTKDFDKFDMILQVARFILIFIFLASSSCP